MKVNLNGIFVGPEEPTYVIAEIGQNHNGSLELAKQLIQMSYRCGANAVKFQKRHIPEELTEEAYNKPYDSPHSYGRTYGEHREYLELSPEEHEILFNYCCELGITYFCTPCDVTSVNHLELFDCPFYKVASRDLTNIPLLEKLSTINKPVIISTGMADYDDIELAIKTLNKPKDKLIIMQCTSQYPCSYDNVHLNAIETIREKYHYNVGLSDHTSGIIVSAVSPLFGACIIEKHVTFNRADKGSDHAGSLEENGLKKLIEYLRVIRLAKGSKDKFIIPETRVSREKLERSIVSKIDIEEGTIIKEEMLTLKSPGIGLKWKEMNKVIGKTAMKTIGKDSLINLKDLK